uniref:Uncharacterized protein n=1 Tax=Brassica oleracea var. oleracea TaxID=109376 RepID=A0A0D3CRT3_BRAOL
MVFHHMVLIFHSFKGFSYVDLDMQVFQIWKTSGLEDFQARRLPDDFQEVFQTTSGKSSDGIFSYISLS